MQNETESLRSGSSFWKSSLLHERTKDQHLKTSLELQMAGSVFKSVNSTPFKVYNLMHFDKCM